MVTCVSIVADVPPINATSSTDIALGLETAAETGGAAPTATNVKQFISLPTDTG